MALKDHGWEMGGGLLGFVIALNVLFPFPKAQPEISRDERAVTVTLCGQTSCTDKSKQERQPINHGVALAIASPLTRERNPQFREREFLSRDRY